MTRQDSMAGEVGEGEEKIKRKIPRVSVRAVEIAVDLGDILSSVLNLSCSGGRRIQESGTWRDLGWRCVFGIRGHIGGNSNHERGGNNGGERRVRMKRTQN